MNQHVSTRLIHLVFLTLWLPFVVTRELQAGDEDGVARVAAVAMHSELGDYDANLARIEYWTRKAHRFGAKFVVFPEWCITGALSNSKMTPGETRRIAKRALDVAVPRLEELCRTFEVTLVVGTIEPIKDHMFSSALIVGPAGRITTFRKLRPANPAERAWFEPGETLPVIESQHWKFSVLICADMCYAEYFSAAAIHGAEFIAIPTCAVGRPDLVNKQTGDLAKAAEYERLLRLRFLPDHVAASRVYAFDANQSGHSGGNWYPGTAHGFGPRGTLLDEHHASEGMIVTPISKALLTQLRADLPPQATPGLRNGDGNPVAVTSITVPDATADSGTLSSIASKSVIATSIPAYAPVGRTERRTVD